MSAHDIKILLVAKHSKNKKFESLLKEVFPTEIPVELIDQVVLEFVDGTQAKLVDVNNVEQQTNKKVKDVLGKHFD